MGSRLRWMCLCCAMALGCADAIRQMPLDAGLDAEVEDAVLPPVVDAEPPDDAAPDPDFADALEADAADDEPVDAALDSEPDAEAPEPCTLPEEVCNGVDDDCDGAVDEDAVCCRENPELCNGADDDCDGQIDEGADCCEPADEVCNDADDDCDGEVDEGDVCCVPERCSGVDDDCDGEIDEGDVCCMPRDEECNDADDDCDGEIDEGGACCGPEVCNGVDDDCDLAADEGSVCGVFVQNHCRLFWAWADSRRGPAATSGTWGGCPANDRFTTDDVRCVGTRYDGRFARLSLNGDVNDDDQFGFALLCRPDADADLASWVQTRCALYVGYADENRAPNGGAAFGGCPPNLEVRNGNLRCTSTGFDGRFRPLYTQGDVDDNDDLSFAWKCTEDPMRPGLAASVQGQVEVFAGWADERRGPVDGSETWSTCPGARNQQRGDVRCVGTAGDGQFHKLNLIGDVNGDDQAGIALRVR